MVDQFIHQREYIMHVAIKINYVFPSQSCRHGRGACYPLVPPKWNCHVQKKKAWGGKIHNSFTFTNYNLLKHISPNSAGLKLNLLSGLPLIPTTTWLSTAWYQWPTYCVPLNATLILICSRPHRPPCTNFQMSGNATGSSIWIQPIAVHQI